MVAMGSFYGGEYGISVKKSEQNFRARKNNFSPVGFSITLNSFQIPQHLEATPNDPRYNINWRPAALAFAGIFIKQVLKTEEFKNTTLDHPTAEHKVHIKYNPNRLFEKGTLLAVITMANETDQLKMRLLPEHVNNGKLVSNRKSSGGVDLSELLLKLVRIEAKDHLNRYFTYNRIAITHD